MTRKFRSVRSLPARPSLESLRKEAKKLARAVVAGDAAAVARARGQLSDWKPPLSRRDAQLVLAREYGFAGWKDLREAVLEHAEEGLERAALQAERAIHENDTERLGQLLAKFPGLLMWRDEEGGTLLGAAAASFGDSGDPYRERMFTRPVCAELLIDAGAVVDPDLWKDVVSARASGMLQLLRRKGVLPRTLVVYAALGDLHAVRSCFGDAGVLRTATDAAEGLAAEGLTADGSAADGLAANESTASESTAKESAANASTANASTANESAAVNEAFLRACRFKHAEVASFLLEQCIARDAKLGRRIEAGPGRSAFIDYLGEHPQDFGGPWRTFVVNEIMRAIEEDDLPSFVSTIESESELLGDSCVNLQVELLERSTLLDRASFIRRLLYLEPALLRTDPAPRSSALEFAIEYGHAHLVPLLTRIWPLPDDLPHAVGVGNFAGVRHWFDQAGYAALGDLTQHYPVNNPAVRGNLRWGTGDAQQVLDVALAWACMNKQLEIAEFLVAHGADVNTDWSTHEPASILHECAMRGNFEAAQFLIDHGVDLTIRDHRWNATAAGWAWNATKDEAMTKFLMQAEKRRQQSAD